MTSSAYSTVFTRERIQVACREYCKASGKGSAGVDEVSLAAFKQNIGMHVGAIFQDLRSSYSFMPLKPVRVEKPNGKGYRIICVPTVRDRVVQRMLVDHLMSLPSAARVRNEASYVNRRGIRTPFQG